MHTLGFLTCVAGLWGTASADFGLTTSNTSYTVDTNGGLVFKVDRANGDITSLIYNGVQYQETTKMSQINSGLGTSNVTAETVNGYIKITVKAGSQPLTQYYVAKSGDPIIYMATYITGEIAPGELRWLARLQRKQVPTGVHGNVADLDGCEAFEGKDTFKCPDGTTRCKMYTSDRFIDDKVHGVTGNKTGVWMVMPGNAYESSSGGPFMRDINSQSTAEQELYFYMYSGHLRTERLRVGLKGPYRMVFTSSTQPPSANVDMSFFDCLNIDGYVPDSGRGSVSGTATGITGNFETVVHWFNGDAQYWIKAVDGKFTSPLMKPGKYTMKLYRNEFPVANTSVTVTAGGKTTQDIVSTESEPSIIWRIGEFDGQPFEMKNGDKFLRMHPSDVRMASWGGEYTVGTSQSKDFPMAIFSKIGGNATIHFDLTADQLDGVVVRVGTTLSFKGGRPSIIINGWHAADPGPPTLIDSRGVTRGAYRGYGDVYTSEVPASALKTGTNTLVLGVLGTGDGAFLSANYIIDAIELQGKGGAKNATSLPLPAHRHQRHTKPHQI
ncbi:rhamnogalacturonase B [Colletotrichum orchidophilum]|uniref:rhamnogalacturonan endolyase n=1 Tax=Colletotrichum orchidophilum TaxID=1209926 RepID=A0A1G4BHV8_9PEZI|nr:rhamnogalacturonase B [Colletotrichum orchidophilum]OHF00888.1 rhamnogalacturonase B [Colletotrichum orchidophilum]